MVDGSVVQKVDSMDVSLVAWMAVLWVDYLAMNWAANWDAGLVACLAAL